MGRDLGQVAKVALVVGYGTDSNPVDYWLMKNSWGDQGDGAAGVFDGWLAEGFGVIAPSRPDLDTWAKLGQDLGKLGRLGQNLGKTWASWAKLGQDLDTWAKVVWDGPTFSEIIMLV